AFRMEADPDDPDSPRALSNWGDRLQAIHRPQEAGNAYRKAMTRLEKLVTALPEIAEYRQELAYNLFAAAVSLSTDREPIPDRTHRQFRVVYQTLPPDHQRMVALRFDRLSWQLVTGSDPTLGNASRAVELAKKAVELGPKNEFYWQTLGVAQYRARNWRAA